MRGSASTPACPTFFQLASPTTFHRDPELAWGFYGHRRALYRATWPHAGIRTLRDLVEGAPTAGAVFTSNVDGQFQLAGVTEDAVAERHGSIHWEQCLAGCGSPTWEADPQDVEVEPATMRAVGRLPACPACGSLARPNVLLFGDGGWDPRRTDAQEARLAALLEAVRGEEVVVIEVGAGTAIPTVRWFAEELTRSHAATLVRINPAEADGGHVALRAGGLEALTAIADALERG